MPDSSTTPANLPAVTLQLKEPQFTPGEWPCTADWLGQDEVPVCGVSLWSGLVCNAVAL